MWENNRSISLNETLFCYTVHSFINFEITFESTKRLINKYINHSHRQTEQISTSTSAPSLKKQTFQFTQTQRKNLFVKPAGLKTFKAAPEKLSPEDDNEIRV